MSDSTRDQMKALKSTLRDGELKLKRQRLDNEMVKNQLAPLIEANPEIAKELGLVKEPKAKDEG